MPVHKINIPGLDHQVDIEQKGLPVSQEALFLLKFLRSSINPRLNPGIAADLGCGTGLLSIALCHYFPSLHVKAFEIQNELADIALQNIERNNVADRISVITGDIRSKKIRPKDQSCDLIITNPPFRMLKTGKMSPDNHRRMANHEIAGRLSDFISVGSISLKHKGVIAVVMIPERLVELLAIMKESSVPVFAIQCVHHSRDKSANAVLVLGRKGGRGGLIVSPPLIIHSSVA